MNAQYVDNMLLVEWIHRVRETCRLILPEDWQLNLFITGVVLVVVGILIGTFGAAYAKGILSAFLGGGGFLIGQGVAGYFEFPTWAGGIIGFVALAVLGYFAFRLWVGIVLGLGLCGMGMMAYGQGAIWENWIEFEQAPQLGIPEQQIYQIPSELEVQELASRSLLEYFKDFYAYTWEKQPNETRNASIIGCVCLILGMIMGICWTRAMLILCSAALATVIFLGGVSSFAEHFRAGAWETKIALHPYGTLSLVVACFVLSALVQYRMTRVKKAKSPAE